MIWERVNTEMGYFTRRKRVTFSDDGDEIYGNIRAHKIGQGTF